MTFEEKLELCWEHHVPYAIVDTADLKPSPRNPLILEWPSSLPDEVKRKLEEPTEV